MRRCLCGRRLVISLVAVVAVFLWGDALAARGALAQEAHVSIDQVVVSESGDEAVAYVSALDEFSRPVQEVTDLTVSVDGQRVDPASVAVQASADAGIAIVLGIDASGSMGGEPLARAQEAAISFVGQLLANDEVGLAVFSGEPPAGVAFVTDRQAALDAISALAADGGNGTALYDAVATMIEGARAAPLQRRAILLLTDGNDTGDRSATSRDDVLDLARSAGVPFYAVGLGTAADEGFLRELAGVSSGRYFAASGAADIPAVFDAIATTLRGQVVVTFDMPEPGEAQRTLVLSLRVGETLYTAEATFQDRRLAPVAGDTGGRSLGPALLLGIAVVGGGLVAFALVAVALRRRRDRSPIAGGPGADPSLPMPEQAGQPAHAYVDGRLIVVSGPSKGASASLEGGPVTIGAEAGSALRLEALDGYVAPSHARAWLQGSRLMLHHIGGSGQTVVNEQPVEWATLEPGETLRIGSDVIAFQLS